MKNLKKFSVLVCICLFIFVSGCVSSEVKTMVCTKTGKQNNLEIDLRYEVEYQSDVVEKVKSQEKIKSSTPSVLESYKDSVTYAPYKDIEYYNTDLVIDGDTLTSTVIIDYSKIDTKKLIEIDSSIGQILKDGKISISDMQSLYESIGATCER